MEYDNLGFGGGLIGVFWIALILVVAWILKAYRADGDQAAGKDRERLEHHDARSEVSKKELDKRHRDSEH